MCPQHAGCTRVIQKANWRYRCGSHPQKHHPRRQSPMKAVTHGKSRCATRAYKISSNSNSSNNKNKGTREQGSKEGRPAGRPSKRTGDACVARVARRIMSSATRVLHLQEYRHHRQALLEALPTLDQARVSEARPVLV